MSIFDDSLFSLPGLDRNLLRKRQFRLPLIFLLSLASLLVPASGEEPFENARITLDLSSRLSTVIDGGSEGFTHFVGLDAHNLFADENGDWGTFVGQLYMVGKDPDGAETDWMLTTRMLNLNMNFLGKFIDGAPNIRLGHYEIPFGLEHLINTNGTLHNFMHAQNLGLKPDWGVFLNDENPAFEYELGVSRGSGMHYRRSGDPYAVSGRIGSPNEENFVMGASFYRSKLHSSPGVRRTRYGIDLQRYFGAYGLLGDFALGDDEGESVSNSLIELNWRNPDETVFAYLYNTPLLNFNSGSIHCFFLSFNSSWEISN